MTTKTPGSAEGAAPARTRPVLRRLSLSLVAVAFAVFAASALAGSHAAKGSFVINGSISSTDPVVINPWYATGRTTCSSGVPNAQASGTFHYRTHRFRNLRGENPSTSGETCVNVSLLVHSGTASVSGYAGPNDGVSVVRGSAGGFGAGQSGDFEYDVGTSPTPNLFDVVVYETGSVSATYTLLVEGIGIIMVGGPTATASLQSFRASAAPKGVLVRWKTRSEHEALGFNVYRGDKKKVRLTRSIVRASGNGRGHTYSYLDRSARKGKAAPYYLEVVQRSGSKIMFGPAVKAAR